MNSEYNLKEATGILAGAICHTIESRGFDRTKRCIEQIWDEVAVHNSYGTEKLFWVSFIRHLKNQPDREYRVFKAVYKYCQGRWKRDEEYKRMLG